MRRIPGFAGMMLPLVVAGAVPVAAQGTTTASLKAAQVRASHDFSHIVGLRELSDGRVLVADAIEKRVVVADLASGATADAAASGQGPAEFTNASAIWPLSRDSSLMADMSSRRWHIFVGSRLVGLVPPDHPAQLASGSSVLGTDTLGFILARRSIQREHGIAHFGTLDSLLVLRVDRRNGDSDTVATIAPREGTIKDALVPAGRQEALQ